MKMSVKPAATKPSGLSMLLKASESKAVVPFAAYARVLAPKAGSGGASTPVPTITLSLYFPHSTQPSKAIKAIVRKESKVEEVVGLGLFLFSEHGRKPELEDGLEDEGREREIKLSTRGWGLRIVEDDGEVDEDFPGACDALLCARALRLTSRTLTFAALDRDASVVKFSFLEFAISEATPSQSRSHHLKSHLPLLISLSLCSCAKHRQKPTSCSASRPIKAVNSIPRAYTRDSRRSSRLVH